jgi:hypothetical protein
MGPPHETNVCSSLTASYVIRGVAFVTIASRNRVKEARGHDGAANPRL